MIVVHSDELPTFFFDTEAIAKPIVANQMVRWSILNHEQNYPLKFCLAGGSLSVTRYLVHPNSKPLHLYNHKTQEVARIVVLGDEKKVNEGDIATLVGPDHPVIEPNAVSKAASVSVYDILMHMNPNIPKFIND